MRFSLTLGLVAVAITLTSTAATVVIPTEDQVGKTGDIWRKLPIPSGVSITPPEKNQDEDCSLLVTVETTKCTGSAYRWGSVFQAYDEHSRNSWNVSMASKAHAGDLYSKLIFKAKCGTNGRIFPTDQIENMKPEKVLSQGVRFFASKTYSAAWIEATPNDLETKEKRDVAAPIRTLHWSDTPTELRGAINDSAPMGYENTLLTTRQTKAELYIEFCK